MSSSCRSGHTHERVRAGWHVQRESIGICCRKEICQKELNVFSTNQVLKYLHTLLYRHPLPSDVVKANIAVVALPATAYGGRGTLVQALQGCPLLIAHYCILQPLRPADKPQILSAASHPILPAISPFDLVVAQQTHNVTEYELSLAVHER